MRIFGVGLVNMEILGENIYNQRTSRSESKLKMWRYAGLMLTYKCSAACAFCYYNCSSKSGGLMPIETALSAWSSLKNLAGEDAKVHITGGEPFLYFDHLAELVTEAKSAGLKGLDSVETNGSWATDRKMAVERIKLLDNAGMDRLKISWDPFHAEFIEQEKVELLVNAACEVLGRDRVLVRWEKYLQFPVKNKPSSVEERKEIYMSAVRDYPSRFTGRGAGMVADLFADKTAGDLAGLNCSKSFLGSKGIHIDPYGNVFSGLCSGIIIGNVNSEPLDQMWRRFDPERSEFFGTLFCESSHGLLDKAVEMGYKAKTAYADKCHLCTDLRTFFFDKEAFSPIIGPSDCYGRQTQKSTNTNGIN